MAQAMGWSNTTAVFYVLLWLASFVLPAAAHKELRWRRGRTDIGIAAVMILLLAVKGFAYCGTDLIGGYQVNFFSATSWEAFSDKTMELGYILWNLLVRFFTDHYGVMVFLYAVITLIPVWYLANKYRAFTEPYAVLAAYSAVFFLPGISLIRIYLAASLCLLSFDALLERKNIKAVLWVVLAVTFHRSAAIMLIPCFVKICRINSRVFTGGMLLAAIVLYFGNDIFQMFFSGRYSIYSIEENGGIGLAQFFYYLPPMLLYAYIRRYRGSAASADRNTEMTDRILDLSYMWCVIGLFIGIVSYAVPIIGRMAAFTLPMIFFFGSAMKRLRTIDRTMYYVTAILLAVYLFVRFWIYLRGYYLLDGIMPYRSIFG